MKKTKKNKIVRSIDKEINKKQKWQAKVESCQRFRDLILNIIDKHFSNKIDKILRKIEFSDLQMGHAKQYTNKKLGGKNE